MSGLPYRSDQEPAAEVAGDVLEEQFESNLARLALALVDAMRLGGEDGKGARKNAVAALYAEVRRRERELDESSSPN